MDDQHDSKSGQDDPCFDRTQRRAPAGAQRRENGQRPQQDQGGVAGEQEERSRAAERVP